MIYCIYLFVITVLVALDQLTKSIIVKNLELYDTKTIINNFFDITYVQNFGAGFSILQNQKIFLVLVSLVAIVLLLFILLKYKNDNDIFTQVSLLLILSGAIGNLIDRLRIGYVIDFLDFIIFTYDFPVFNVADCFITIGCFMLIIKTIMEYIDAKN